MLASQSRSGGRGKWCLLESYTNVKSVAGFLFVRGHVWIPEKELLQQLKTLNDIKWGKKKGVQPLLAS